MSLVLTGYITSSVMSNGKEAKDIVFIELHVQIPHKSPS